MNIVLLAENSNKVLDDILTVVILVLFVLFLVGYKLLEKRRLNAPKKEVVTTPKVETPRVRKQIKLEDIKDEDMMVACLIATIDYANEIKEDVHLVSVREL